MNKVEIIKELGAGIAQQGLNLLEILSEKTGSGKEIVAGVSRFARGETKTLAQSAEPALGAPSLADKLEAGAISGKRSLATAASDGSGGAAGIRGDALEGLLETSFNRRRFLTTSATGVAAAKFGALDAVKSLGSTMAPATDALMTAGVPINVATRAAVGGIMHLPAWQRSAHLTEIVKQVNVRHDWERLGKYFGEPEPKTNLLIRKPEQQLLEVSHAPDRVSSIDSAQLREPPLSAARAVGDRASIAVSRSDNEASEISHHASYTKSADSPAVAKDASDVSKGAPEVSRDPIKVPTDATAVSTGAAEVDMGRRRLLGGAAALGVGKVVGLPTKMVKEVGRAVTQSPFVSFNQAGYQFVQSRALAMAEAGINLDFQTGKRILDAARNVMAESGHSALVEMTHSAGFDAKLNGLNVERLPGGLMRATKSADFSTELPQTLRLSGDETHVSGATNSMRINGDGSIVHNVESEQAHNSPVRAGRTEPVQAENFVHVEISAKQPNTLNLAESTKPTGIADGQTETSSNTGFLGRWSARKRAVIEGK